MTRNIVSIVIPTLNGGAVFARLLAAIDEQADRYDCRIVAVDSGSTDDTLPLLRARGADIVELPRGAFNHGTSRNAGLARASGDFAVLMVQDAVPASARWLDALIAPLVEDRLVAGSFARQLPWPAASALTAHYLRTWVAAQETSRVVGPLTAAEFERMEPSARHLECAFDNVCSCVRLETWRSHLFRAAPIAEDLEWAREVLLAGYRLAYAPAAVVWHSHERSASYELQRTYLVHQRLQALFGLSTVPTVGCLVRSVAATLPAHVRLASRDGGRAIGRGVALAMALPLGQYLGARSARIGRELLRTRGV